MLALLDADLVLFSTSYDMHLFNYSTGVTITSLKFPARNNDSNCAPRDISAIPGTSKFAIYYEVLNRRSHHLIDHDGS